MKVTVCFNDVRVVVPCGSGHYLVKNLVQDAIARYHKALAKSSVDNWLVNTSSLRLMVADGGILDPDDSVTDVLDDREQLTMIMEEPIGHRHHSNGDGMSVGTSSPVSFQDEVTPNMAAVGRHDDKSRPLRYGDVLKGSDQQIEPSRSLLQATVTSKESTSPASCTVDISVVSGLEQAQLANYARGSQQHTVSSSDVQTGGNHAAHLQADEAFHNKPRITDNSVGQSWPATDLQTDVETLIIEFPKSSQPLGVHVIPELDEVGRNRGLVIQGLAPGGRAQHDNRLRVGDLFTQINGTDLFHVDFARAQELFRRAMLEQRLQITVLRRGNSPVSIPPNQVSPSSKPSPADGRRSGNVTSNLETKHSATDSISSTKSNECGVSSSETKAKKVAPPVVARSRSISYEGDDGNTRLVHRKLIVLLVKGNAGLGFTVTTRASPDPSRCFVYIKNILPDGAALKDGRLKPGDLLLEINGQNMTDKTQNDAVEMLRNTPLGGAVQLVVYRQLMEKQTSPAQKRVDVCTSAQPRPVSALQETSQEMATNTSAGFILASDAETADRVSVVEDSCKEAIDHSIHSVTSSASSASSASPDGDEEHETDDMQVATVANIELTEASINQEEELNSPVPVSDLSTRRALSMENLNTLDRKNSIDQDQPVDSSQYSKIQLARNVNQSFRAAVDKSYDGPSLYTMLSEAKWQGELDNKKEKKENGKSGLKWLFRLPRHRSKSVSAKEPPKRPDITLVFPRDNGESAKTENESGTSAVHPEPIPAKERPSSAAATSELSATASHEIQVAKKTQEVSSKNSNQGAEALNNIQQSTPDLAILQQAVDILSQELDVSPGARSRLEVASQVVTKTADNQMKSEGKKDGISQPLQEAAAARSVEIYGLGASRAKDMLVYNGGVARIPSSHNPPSSSRRPNATSSNIQQYANQPGQQMRVPIESNEIVQRQSAPDIIRNDERQSSAELQCRSGDVVVAANQSPMFTRSEQFLASERQLSASGQLLRPVSAGYRSNISLAEGRGASQTGVGTRPGSSDERVIPVSHNYSPLQPAYRRQKTDKIAERKSIYRLPGALADDAYGETHYRHIAAASVEVQHGQQSEVVVRRSAAASRSDQRYIRPQSMEVRYDVRQQENYSFDYQRQQSPQNNKRMSYYGQMPATDAGRTQRADVAVSAAEQLRPPNYRNGKEQAVDTRQRYEMNAHASPPFRPPASNGTQQSPTVNQLQPASSKTNLLPKPPRLLPSVRAQLDEQRLPQSSAVNHDVYRSPDVVSHSATPPRDYKAEREIVIQASNEYPKPIAYNSVSEFQAGRPPAGHEVPKRPLSSVTRNIPVTYGPPRLAPASYQLWNPPEPPSQKVASSRNYVS